MFRGDVKSDIFIVIDLNKETMLTLMEAGGSKMDQLKSIPNYDQETEEDKLSDYEISSLPNQTIAGYYGEGLQMKNKEYLIKYYFTNDLPLTLNGMNRDKESAELAKNLNGIKVKGSGLMMKMEMADLNKKKQYDYGMQKSCNVGKDNFQKRL